MSTSLKPGMVLTISFECVDSQDIDQEKLKHVCDLIQEINDHLEFAATNDAIESPDVDSRGLRICGLEYLPIEVRLGVVEAHRDSDAVATLVVLQNPSANEYRFEISIKWLESYAKIVRDRMLLYNSVYDRVKRDIEFEYMTQTATELAHLEHEDQDSHD